MCFFADTSKGTFANGALYMFGCLFNDNRLFEILKNL